MIADQPVVSKDLCRTGRAPGLVRVRAASAAAWLIASWSAHAEPGVTDKQITVGQMAIFSGPVAATGTSYRSGFEFYFAQLNAGGCINGRKLSLLATYDPASTASNACTLIEKHKVFARVGLGVTANLAPPIPIPEESGTSLFALLVGATSFRLQPHHHVFHVRASRREALSTLINQLPTLGVRRIAIVQHDSAFGRSNLENLLQLGRKRGPDVAAGARSHLEEAIRLMPPSRWSVHTRLDAAWLDIERGDLDIEKFIRALEGLGSLDVGDFIVDCSPNNHNDSNFVTLEMYLSDGTFLK